MNSNFSTISTMRNQHGIEIKMCCASCQHKCLTDMAERKCEMTGKRVRANHKCDDWELSEKLEMLGCEQGKVQRRAYQLTLLEVRASESLAMMRGQTVTPKPLEDIQMEFETEHGSRFLIR